MIKILAVISALLFAVAGCSSSDSSTSESASPTPTEKASLVAPIEVSERGTINVKVGNTVNVTTEGVTQVTTDNSTVLDVFVPKTDESAQFNGGAKVIGEGDANMVVYGANNKKLYTVAVISSGQVSAPSPSTVG